MTNKQNIIALSLLVAVPLTSCLKDDDHLYDFSNVQPVIELPEKPGTNGFVIKTIDQAPSADLNLLVNLAAPGTANTDLKVKLAFNTDTSILYKINKDLLAANPQAKTYELLPDSLYTVPSWEVTIPAGKNLANFVIKINSTKIDFSRLYAIPVKLVEVPKGYVLPSNFSKSLIKIVVRNRFEGKYLMKGYVLRAGDNVLSGYFKNQEYSLITTGANSVIFSRVQCWANGVGAGGINPWELTVDASNKVTVKNGDVKNNPDYDSRYEPDKKTFYISVNWSTNPSTRAAIDTIVYSGPR